MSETLLSLIRPLEASRRIIWLGFLFTVLVYVCIAWTFSAQTGSDTGSSPSKTFTILLVILSLLAAVLAPIVPRLMVPDSRLRQLINQPPEGLARNPRTHTLDEDRLARIKTLTVDEQRLLALVSAMFVGFIVRLAFNESIALYGLVIAFFSRSFVAILPFAIVSLALNFMVPTLLDLALKRATSLGLEPGGIQMQPL
jgi:ATP synthase subunit C